MRVRNAVAIGLAALLVVLSARLLDRVSRPRAALRGGAPVVAERVRVRPAPARPVDPVLAVAPDAPRTPVPPGVGRSLVLAGAAARAGDLGRIARDLLDENAAALGLAAMPGDLVLEREFDSLSGHHVRFEQRVGGVPVEGSRVAAHVAPDGRPLLVSADVYPLRGLRGLGADVTPTVSAASAASARESACEFATDDEEEGRTESLDIREPDLVVRPAGHTGALAWRVGVRTDHESLHVYVDARDGAVIAARDLRVTADGRAMIFDPNPVHSEADRTLTDQGDRDYGGLDRARRLVTLQRLDGTGYLRGQWADLLPSPVSAFAADLDWTWATRSNDTFEQLMCYYHIDRTQERLRALGLENVNAESQRVNAHARAADQSNYDIMDDVLEFGDGGVDDGEDADIVIHEYGHAIQFDQVGDFGRTGEGGAIGEGFADFLAVVMHESARPNWDVLVASWDATSYSNQSPPYLRRVDRDKRFPADYAGEVHEDGELWSRFLYDLRNLVGADDALRLAVEGHFFLTPNARFRDASDALLVANISLRGGRDDASIRALLDARGLPYSVPSAPLPDEEAFEDNDTIEQAAPLGPGVYEQFLLADDDWFRVHVPPLSRVIVRATFDGAGMDLDLASHDPEGRPAQVSDGVSGVEEISSSAGPEGHDVLVRVHLAPGDLRPGAYDLTIEVTELEVLGPVQTVVRRVEPGERWAFRVSVSPTKAEDLATLRVVTRRLKRGAKSDVRLLAPDAEEVVPFDSARRKKGGKAIYNVDRAGDWVVQVLPRDGASGRYRLKINLR